MTDTPPPAGPPPQQPPPQQPWQQPAWAQPPYASQQQSGQQQWGAPPFAPPRKTNGLAIASLILGLAWVVVGPLALFTGIAAAITGHIARKQIRERDENGAGMALAGLILGYVSIAISILVAIGISIFIFGVVPNLVQDEVRNDARVFGRAVVSASIDDGGSPRNAKLLREVYFREAGGYTFGDRGAGYGCCHDDELMLPDGTPVDLATDADWKRNNWQLEFRQTFLGDKVACLTIPPTQSLLIDVTEGRCSA